MMQKAFLTLRQHIFVLGAAYWRPSLPQQWEVIGRLRNYQRWEMVNTVISPTWVEIHWRTHDLCSASFIPFHGMSYFNVTTYRCNTCP